LREIRKAILLAAGRGVRLGPLTADTPKTLLDISGKPMLSHIIEGFALTGIESFIIVTGYLAHQVEDFGRRFSADHPELKIETVRQHELNGTAGAMLCARSFAARDDFVFGWGDILMDRENYPRFVKSARETSYDLLLAVNRTRDPCRGAAVYVDWQMRVQRLVEKPPPVTSTTN